VKLSKTTRIVLIIVAGVVLLGYGVLAFLSENFNFESILGALGTFISGILLGVLGTSGRK
jgi:hypothetical protein